MLLQYIAPGFALAAGAAQAASLSRRAPLYPHDIQGAGYLSPYSGKTVSNVQGVVTGLNSAGCYIQTPASAWDNDDRTSEGLYVFGNCTGVAVNDLISVNGVVAEYRNGADNLALTELTKPTGFTIVKANALSERKVTVIGVDRKPPTEYIGIEDPFALPANTTTLEKSARAFDPTKFGADFWESLEGMLVTLQSPTVTQPLDSFKETFVVPGGTPVTSRNARGGLTLAAKDTTDAKARWDVNPELIDFGVALDKTSLPADIVLGDKLADTTGVVSYAFGNPVFYPLTAPAVAARISRTIPATTLIGTGSCSDFTPATFNVENLGGDASSSSRLTKIGSQISNYLGNPDVVVANEIQDNNGATNDAVVSANVTLTNLVNSIAGAKYAWTDIDPTDDQDGGEPGGNIRTSFLYRTDRLKLGGTATRAGTATEAVTVSSDASGKAQLSVNPGRIEPGNTAWSSSRKPLVAQFQLTSTGQSVFIIGAHLTSKGGSTNMYANPQPPINGGVSKRESQANLIRDFVSKILSVEPDANVVLLGDLNDFSSTQPLDALSSGNVLDEILVPAREERYSYSFAGNQQEIDHIFASPNLANAQPKIEVVHVNTWTTTAEQTSDHDPVVAQFNVC